MLPYGSRFSRPSCARSHRVGEDLQRVRLGELRDGIEAAERDELVHQPVGLALERLLQLHHRRPRQNARENAARARVQGRVGLQDEARRTPRRLLLEVARARRRGSSRMSASRSAPRVPARGAPWRGCRSARARRRDPPRGVARETGTDRAGTRSENGSRSRTGQFIVEDMVVFLRMARVLATSRDPSRSRTCRTRRWRASRPLASRRGGRRWC